jgi:hypothetical protein
MVNIMASNSPLGEWKFLIGTWKGKTKAGQFGEKGVIEGSAVFSFEPSESFILGTGENWCEGRLLNKSISILFYDDGEKKFRRKTFFSYGFVNNEVECARTKDIIKFDIATEPLSKQVGPGMLWRSTLKKISDTKIATGLEMAKPGQEFRSYGESILEKAK